MSDELRVTTREELTVGLPGKGNQSDEATVAFSAPAAAGGPEAASGDEPTAKLPRATAGKRTSADGPTPSDGDGDQDTTVLPEQAPRPERAALPEQAAEPREAGTAADVTMPLRPGPDPDEVTVTLSTPPEAGEPDAVAPQSAGSEVDAAVADATVALPLAPKAAPGNTEAAGEATVAIPAAPEAGAAGEATVAIPAAPEVGAAADATVAIPATRKAGAAADATVAIPAAPRTAAATAVAPADRAGGAAPPADPTVALPSAMSTPEPPAPSGRNPLLSRRRLLLAGGGVAIAAIAGGIAAAAAGSKPEAAGPSPQSTPKAVTTTKSREPATAHVTTPPVPARKAPIFTLPEYRKATGKGPLPADAIALTIDDGPHPVWTPKILQLLDKYHVPAMFCMIGNQVLGHENIAKMVTAAGHQLANHTWSHPTSLEKKTGGAVHNEILRAQEKIHDTTGYTPKFFRSPGGAWSPTVLQQTAAAGLLPLDWTNDPKDWSRPGVGKIEHTMLAAHPGQILLCHDGGGDRSQTYSALKDVLPQLKARGLHFIAL